MDKVPSRRSSPEQKRSLHHLEIFISHSLLEPFIFYLSTLYSLSLPKNERKTVVMERPMRRTIICQVIRHQVMCHE